MVSISIPSISQDPGRTFWGGVPSGFDALLVGSVVSKKLPNQTVLFVARDDAKLALFQETLAYFAPQLDILVFPSWDSMPYDRVSPSRKVMAQRIETLVKLLKDPDRKRCVITTVSALGQRILPRESLRDKSLLLKKGQETPSDEVVNYCVLNGYQRVETVREAGEYAVRGGILDLYPSGSEMPVRLDFFGDVLESLRTFDPVTQRSTQTIDALSLTPASEVFLTEETVKHFRTLYRETFGAESHKDHLYESISAHHAYAGQENWLPLFYEKLETLLDYLPSSYIFWDAQAEEAKDNFLQRVMENYDVRKDLLKQKKGVQEDGMVYRPLDPPMLYITPQEWKTFFQDYPSCFLSPFVQEGAEDLGGRQSHIFVAERKAGLNIYEVLKEYASTREGKISISAYSEGSRDRLRQLLEDHGMKGLLAADSWQEVQQALRQKKVPLTVLGLSRGFQYEGFELLTEEDILGDRIARKGSRRKTHKSLTLELSGFQPGDLVVHREHGLGRYEGLKALDINGAAHDCLQLVYAQNDKLFVPVENIETLSYYSGPDDGASLDKLGSTAWQNRKARVKKRIKEIAQKLMGIAAARQLRQGHFIEKQQGLFEEFCARFAFVETEDQLKAIEDVLDDMVSGKPMDRLICGDVGFGKTEVALRSAFIAAMAGFQVAVIAPTTLLCNQHYQTFQKRFSGFPMRIAQLSRMVSAKESQQVRKELEAGMVHIIVATHALFSNQIKFQNLGLLVVDEEQHFGVTQKERLKELQKDVHVLTLTATPIPRTLQMALTGIREMSIIATPPVDRLAVRTFVLPYDKMVIREAIQREKYRGGQTYYVCPRLSDLPQVREKLYDMLPELRVGIAHGQMPPTQLQEVMKGFCEGAFDVLLSTNIVESGLDIPTANTLIIHRADMFGLSQLYQLRGRVGRGKQRGYAYFTLPAHQITPTAQKRLEVMQTLEGLGAGFALASHDMDIRGAGNLVGDEQSGHVKEVGVELYQHMLEEAIAELKNVNNLSEELERDLWSPQINIGLPVMIPEGYVQDLNLRLGLYRRLSELKTEEDIESFRVELADRFGPLPLEVHYLLEVIALKNLCFKTHIEKIDAGSKGTVLSFYKNSFPNPEALISYIQKNAGLIKVRPDQKLMTLKVWSDPQKRIEGIKELLVELQSLVS